MEEKLLQEIVANLTSIKKMLANQSQLPKLLNETEAGEALGIRPQTLSVWRHKGIGPDYVKVGNAVRYKASTLAEYLGEKAVKC